MNNSKKIRIFAKVKKHNTYERPKKLHRNQ